MPSEELVLMVACAIYLGAAAAALGSSVRGALDFRLVLSMAGLALAVHTIAIALRWVRLGHGPYVDLFEILSSNVWSLHLVLLAAALAIPRTRPGLGAALPLLSVLTVWLMVTPARDTTLPVTYDTPWLAIHVVLGKAFLGLTLLATGLSLVILGKRFGWRIGTAASATIEPAAHGLMLAAVVFQTLMLAAGAAWARDAWGRYWSWDPLESWAFLTWLAMLGYLHWRSARKDQHALNSALVVGVYVLAFATFFGVPFLSTAPHKGAV